MYLWEIFKLTGYNSFKNNKIFFFNYVDLKLKLPAERFSIFLFNLYVCIESFNSQKCINPFYYVTSSLQ